MRTKCQFRLWVILAGLFFLASTGADARAASSIKEVSMTSYGVGSQAYIFSAGIAEAVENLTGIKTRVIPAGNDVGRMLPLRAGEVDLCIVTGGTGWIVSHGAFDQGRQFLEF